MSRYPNAQWAPWKYNSPSGPTYYKDGNQPVAVVLHVMQGYASTALEWAREGHYGASWHYTVSRAGVVFQHLDHKDGGYHAGIGAGAPKPTWKLWRGHGQNVNSYTVGIEHEGFTGTQFTAEQMAASRELCRWLAGDLVIPFDRDHYPPHADIDLVNRPNDFNSPALRADFYEYLLEEDMGMTPEEKAEMAMLRKIVGGPAANDFNLLQNINDLNAELTAHKANHPGAATMPAGKFKANIEILKEGL